MEPFTTVEAAWQALLTQYEPHFELDLVEHGFQTAEGLEALGMDDEVIAAGLLHDLGDGRVAAEAHAPWAAALVRPLFGERVAWLIAAHAEAKRYLCSVDPDYVNGLSEGSRLTLEEQGGLMTVHEIEAFEAHPWAAAAVNLRRCDDQGKRTDYRVPNRLHFRAILERVAVRSA